MLGASNGPSLVAVDGWVLTHLPQMAWQAGKLNLKELIIGTTTADALGTWPFGIYGIPTDEASYQAMLRWAPFAAGAPADGINARYNISAYGSYAQIVGSMANDRGLVCPARQMARFATLGGIPTRVFLFGSDWAGGNMSMPGVTPDVHYLPPAFLCHGGELLYQWGGTITFNDSRYIKVNNMWQATKPDPSFLTAVQDYIGSFVKTGVPSNTGAAWPAVSGGSVVDYMYLAPPTPVMNGRPSGVLGLDSHCDFWDPIELAGSQKVPAPAYRL